MINAMKKIVLLVSSSVLCIGVATLGADAVASSSAITTGSSVDAITGTQIPWAGANDRGLGLVQVARHTLTSTFAQSKGFSVSRDLQKGMTGGYLNHVILSRAEHVDEVEQILRDTNNGGGFNNSFARNTSSHEYLAEQFGDHVSSLESEEETGVQLHQGGIQRYAFGIENLAFNQYDEFMADLRTGTHSESQLKADISTTWMLPHRSAGGTRLHGPITLKAFWIC